MLLVIAWRDGKAFYCCARAVQDVCASAGGAPYI